MTTTPSKAVLVEGEVGLDAQSADRHLGGKESPRGRENPSPQTGCVISGCPGHFHQYMHGMLGSQNDIHPRTDKNPTAVGVSGGMVSRDSSPNYCRSNAVLISL